MTNSILIGEVIYEVINSSADVLEYIDDRLWPVVAPWTKPEDIHYPFVVYTRNNVSAAGLSKDCYSSDSVSFQIDVISSNYTDGLYIANIIRSLFEGKYIESHGMGIDNIQMNGIKESFSSDSFIQTLSFSCDITNL